MIIKNKGLEAGQLSTRLPSDFKLLYIFTNKYLEFNDTIEIPFISRQYRKLFNLTMANSR